MRSTPDDPLRQMRSASVCPPAVVTGPVACDGLRTSCAGGPAPRVTFTFDTGSERYSLTAASNITSFTDGMQGTDPRTLEDLPEDTDVTITTDDLAVTLRFERPDGVEPRVTVVAYTPTA